MNLGKCLKAASRSERVKDNKINMMNGMMMMKMERLWITVYAHSGRRNLIDHLVKAKRRKVVAEKNTNNIAFSEIQNI